MAWSLGGFIVDAVTERWQKIGGGIYLKDVGAWLMLFPWSLPESLLLYSLSSKKRYLCVVFLPPWQFVPVHHGTKQARTEPSETMSQNRADFIFKLCHCYFVSTQNLTNIRSVCRAAGWLNKERHSLPMTWVQFLASRSGHRKSTSTNSLHIFTYMLWHTCMCTYTQQINK